MNLLFVICVSRKQNNGMLHIAGSQNTLTAAATVTKNTVFGRPETVERTT